MTEPSAIDAPIDDGPETSTPPPQGARFEDLIGSFPECDDEFRRVIREQRKFRRRKEPL